jgi:tetratricopeptide (TPR) repeat protein
VNEFSHGRFEPGPDPLYTHAPMPTTQQQPGRLIKALGAAMILLAGAAAAHGQSKEFKLDESGGFERTTIPEPGSDQAIIGQARELLANDKPAQARSILTTWIDANAREENPYLAEAYLLRGDAITADGNEYKALYDYEAVVNEFPSSPEFVTALERELEIGLRYLGGLRRRFLGIRIEDASSIGEELLVRVQERMPRSQLAETAAIELADYYYRIRDLEMAAEMYGIFLTNFPESEHRKKAMQRRIYSNIARFKGPRYNASPLIEAQYLVEGFAQTYPADAVSAGLNDALVARLDESLATQMLTTGQWYLKQGDGPSARMVLARLIREHPGTVASSRAADIMADKGWLQTRVAPGEGTSDLPAADEPATEPPVEAAPPVDAAQPSGTPPAEPPAQPLPERRP